MARENALNNFANILLKEASAQKKEVMAELDKIRQGRLKQAEAELRRQFEKKVKAGRAEMEQQIRLSLTRREMDLHKTLLENRKKTFSDVFAAVEAKVREFTKTPAYQTFLSEEFQKAAAMFPDARDMVCAVMPQDMELAESLFHCPGLTITASQRDFLGGFTLESQSLRRFADCTLENRIQQQKQNFYETSGLIAD